MDNTAEAKVTDTSGQLAGRRGQPLNLVWMADPIQTRKISKPSSDVVAELVIQLYVVVKHLILLGCVN